MLRTGLQLDSFGLRSQQFDCLLTASRDGLNVVVHRPHSLTSLLSFDLDGLIETATRLWCSGRPGTEGGLLDPESRTYRDSCFAMRPILIGQVLSAA